MVCKCRMAVEMEMKNKFKVEKFRIQSTVQNEVVQRVKKIHFL